MQAGPQVHTRLAACAPLQASAWPLALQPVLQGGRLSHRAASGIHVPWPEASLCAGPPLLCQVFCYLSVISDALKASYVEPVRLPAEAQGSMTRETTFTCFFELKPCACGPAHVFVCCSTFRLPPTHAWMPRCVTQPGKLAHMWIMLCAVRALCERITDSSVARFICGRYVYVYVSLFCAWLTAPGRSRYIVTLCFLLGEP